MPRPQPKRSARDPAHAGLGGQATAGLLASPPALILDVLARARAAGGSYLLAHGVTPAELATRRAGLTD